MPLWFKPSFAAEPPIVGRPIDFSGAIGGPFVVTMNVEPSSVTVEEPFTLTLRIVGPGNLKEIARPPIGKLEGFKPFAVDNLDDSFSAGSPPSRTFRYRLRARSDEVERIPPFKFVYFNPAIVPPSRGYQTTYAAAVELRIKLARAPDEPNLAREVARVRQRLEQEPNDDSALARLTELRQSVNYPSPDMRPAESRWLRWPSLSQGSKMLAAWCLLLAATLAGWQRKHWRAYLFVAAVSLILIGAISVGAFFERQERARNEVTPIVVVGKDAILRRGNGEDYPPRISASLPAGAEVRRLFERPGWLQVELANGVVGWLPADDVIK